ncbi:hypothetical protein AB4Z52_14055 [Rhizobium sp. 2YAF20]|uniref:hypothetical protein n=1 Tax=Rhizobium sp. 2YAF20 TaxID=3233027 RepID=UPI003F9687CD
MTGTQPNEIDVIGAGAITANNPSGTGLGAAIAYQGGFTIWEQETASLQHCTARHEEGDPQGIDSLRLQTAGGSNRSRS